MKNTYSLLIAALGLTLLAAPTQAAERYASAFGGVTRINDGALNTGWSTTAAVGCDYGTNRIEAELGYQNNGMKYTTYDARVLTIMGNGYYDLDLGGADLYATGGVGVAEASATYVGTTRQTNLAYQVGAGIAAPIGDKIMIDARYRYFTTVNFPSLSSHSALLGLRVNF